MRFPRRRLIPILMSLVLVMLGSCVPAAPDNDEFKKFNAATTVMGRIQEAGVLKVGIAYDRPAFATVSPSCATTSPCEGVEGFVIELAEEVADALKVEIEVLAVPNEELIGLIDAGEADLAFPMVPITEELVRKNSFTDPFIVGHQRMMVPEDLIPSDGSFTLEDLAASAGADGRSETVCSYTVPGVGIPVDELVEGLTIRPVAEPGGCGALFLKGEIYAAVGHDLGLAGISTFLEGTCGQGGCPGVPPLPQLTGDQLTTEGYGALVPSGEATWRDFVTQVLEESQQEGRWAELYETWLQPLLGGNVLSPPGMTVEEAAALFPADL